jgi:uncharacterized delta-60 repeat protein
MRSLRRRLFLAPAVLTVAACAFLVAAATAGAAAHLDRGFGSGGIRLLPSSLRETSGVALLGGGRVVVSGEDELVALLPSGRIDRGFGEQGHAPFVKPANSTLETSAVAVDRRGRPVEVGSVAFEAGSDAVLAGSRQKPFVERFTPAGKLDPGFGGGSGYLVSDLGLPDSPDGEPAEAFLSTVSFDAADRLVATGRSSADVGGETGVTAHTRVFLARFDDSGRLDPSFARGGTFFAPENEAISTTATPTPGGEMTVETKSPKRRAILRLDANGAPDPPFGSGGYAPSPFGSEFAPLLVDSRGRTTAYTYVSGVAHRLANGLRLRRLLPDGKIDRGFGDNGTATVRMPRFYGAEPALDAHDRILLAVSLKQRGPIGEPEELALVRLRDNGKIDTSFAPHGMVRIPYPPGTPTPAVYLHGIDVRDEQAAIDATYCGKGDCRPSVALVDLR